MQPSIDKEINLNAQQRIKEIEQTISQHLKALTNLHDESVFIAAKLDTALGKKKKALQDIATETNE